MFVIKTPSEDVPCETLDEARRALAAYAARIGDADAIRDVSVVEVWPRHRQMASAIELLAPSELVRRR